jgi:hypothetical protein
MSVRESVEATLEGQDERLVARCDVPGILAAFDYFGIFDVATLLSSIETSPTALQLGLGSSAPQSFLGLLKTQLLRAAPPLSPIDAAQAQAGAAPPPMLLVVTIQFNGKVLAERTTLRVPPTATWEAVARMRLETVLCVAQSKTYASTALRVSLFTSAEQRASDCVGAAISDTVAGAFALGYVWALLAFEVPVYSCARRPACGLDAIALMMGKARAKAAGTELELPAPYQQKEEDNKLDFELALFNAVLEQCEVDGLGVAACELDACRELLLRVRDAVWMMSGREGEFKWSKVRSLGVGV